MSAVSSGRDKAKLVHEKKEGKKESALCLNAKSVRLVDQDHGQGSLHKRIGQHDLPGDERYAKRRQNLGD